MMLIARHAHTKEYMDANLARLNDEYVCPGCGEPVCLKKGKIKIAHYAHKIFANCGASSEGESALHLQGKLALFQYFSKKYDEVKLEPWLSEIKQRPDLMIRRGDKWTAIEFQCAPITLDQVRKRMAGYRKLHLQTLWILGETYQKKRLLATTMAKFAVIHNFELKIFFWNYKHNIYYQGWWQIDNGGLVTRKTRVNNQLQQLLKIQQSVILAKPKIREIQEYLYKQNRNIVGIPWICHAQYSLPGGLKIPHWQVAVRIIMVLEHKSVSMDEMLQRCIVQDWQQFGCVMVRDVQKLWLYHFLNDALKANQIEYTNGKFKLGNLVKWFDTYQDKLEAFREAYFIDSHILSRKLSN
ncbi:hypothetical protein G9401_06005 [Weissella paramesenteroides]|nr:hypothetical protein [Weissella paramesenteroides]